MSELYSASTLGSIDSKKNDFSYTHSEIGDLEEYAIVSENRLFNHEEAFLARRIFVCLATICEQFPQLSSMLFIRYGVNDEQSKSLLELLSLTLNNFCHYVWIGSFTSFASYISNFPLFYRKT